MKFHVVILTLIVIASSSLVLGQSESKNDAALRLLIKRMADAQIAFDAGTLDAVFTPDFIEISPVGEFDPREKVLGFYKPELKPPGDAMPRLTDLSEYSVRDYGKYAIVIVKLSYTTTLQGKPSPRSMRATFVCRHEKGDWKIASAHYTGIRPPQQPT
jgi:ketosteroid isomerase-like protein